MITSAPAHHHDPLFPVLTALILSTTSVPAHHLAENGITPALGAGCGMVEEVVPCHIDEELRGGGVRGALVRAIATVYIVILEAVVGLVFDLRIGRPFASCPVPCRRPGS
jgi:hypothetical protein